MIIPNFTARQTIPIQKRDAGARVNALIRILRGKGDAIRRENKDPCGGKALGFAILVVLREHLRSYFITNKDGKSVPMGCCWVRWALVRYTSTIHYIEYFCITPRLKCLRAWAKLKKKKIKPLIYDDCFGENFVEINRKFRKKEGLFENGCTQFGRTDWPVGLIKGLIKSCLLFVIPRPYHQSRRPLPYKQQALLR